MSKKGWSADRPPPQRRRLDALVREKAGEIPWSRARFLIESGKVRVEGRTITDPGLLFASDQTLEIIPNAPRPATQSRLTSDAIAYLDEHLVVVRKPPGLSTVPFEPSEKNTLHDLVRAWLNRTADKRKDRATGDLGIVHRIDKDTSGLVVFTRTLIAKRHLAQQFRFHTVERSYLALAHGQVEARTLRSRLVQDRGDGLRGSTRNPRLGIEAITHVQPLEHLPGATFVRCRLETGRTHQIRIQLSEAGHPLLGDQVYLRGYRGTVLPAPRLMLHAAVLGLEHPTHHQSLRFEEPIPADLEETLVSLRGEL